MQVAAFVLDRTTAADPGDITHATDELVQAVLHEVRLDLPLLPTIWPVRAGLVILSS